VVLAATRGRRASSLLVLLLVCGCAARANRLPATAIHRASNPTPHDILIEMREREAALASFRGQATLDYKGPDGASKSSQMIVVQAPERVRIDFMSPFGPTYTVATDGRYLRAYDRGEKVLYVGIPTAANVQRYARVPLTTEVLAALIRGLPPFLARAINERFTPSGFEADLQGGGTLRIELAPDTLYPRRAHVVGTTLGDHVSVQFDQYFDVDGVPVAHRVHAELPDGGTVELEYSRVWRGLRLTDTAFQIDAPGGVRVIGMDAEATGGKAH
jgi:outer membrane lipoprotein-sorting protein